MRKIQQFPDFVINAADVCCRSALPTQVSILAANYAGKTLLRVRSQSRQDDWTIFLTMPTISNNIIQFPVHRRREIRGCPHCGSNSDVWQIGRLLWGYCETHELRWIVASHQSIARATINRRELRKGLEFLSSFAEISF